MVFESRKQPFDADASTSPRSRQTEAERAWRRQVAEAARHAADDLDKDHPQLRQLHADLVDLAARLTANDTDPSEPNDPRSIN
jgi:hypothetical protein